MYTLKVMKQLNLPRIFFIHYSEKFLILSTIVSLILFITFFGKDVYGLLNLDWRYKRILRFSIIILFLLSLMLIFSSSSPYNAAPSEIIVYDEETGEYKFFLHYYRWGSDVVSLFGITEEEFIHYKLFLIRNRGIPILFSIFIQISIIVFGEELIVGTKRSLEYKKRWSLKKFKDNFHADFETRKQNFNRFLIRLNKEFKHDEEISRIVPDEVIRYFEDVSRTHWFFERIYGEFPLDEIRLFIMKYFEKITTEEKKQIFS
ncbi:MAG: hypothetical protein ACE5HW_01685 [Candidatus Methanofastidiosia archaeon]